MPDQALDAVFNQAAAGAAISTGEWAGLKAAAGEGRLRLEPGVAEACARACDDAYDDLVKLQGTLKDDTRLGGLGDWPSGRALARQFNDKAIAGVNSARATLEAHKAVLSDMKDTFDAAAAAYREAERQNADAFGAQG